MLILDTVHYLPGDMLDFLNTNAIAERNVSEEDIVNG